MEKSLSVDFWLMLKNVLHRLHVFGKTTRQVESSIMMRFARGSETRYPSQILYTEEDD